VKKCLISVAMIVKDEENNIRRALESVKDCVDEIIVVDTGSTDRTPEIAKEYTDKLYFHEWQNDFSEARNHSLKFPECEWVMILDGDEEASKEFCENIRKYLSSLPEDVNTIFIPTISYLDWDFKKKEFASTARIFRNGTVYYKNIVHNMPVYKPKIVSIPWPIYHYGYIWTRKLRKKKYERTGTLIRKQLQMAKTQEEKLYYLVQLYKTETTGGKPHTKNAVALQTFKELMRSNRIPTITLEFMYYFANDLMNLGYYKEAEMLLDKSISVDPEYPDAYFGKIALYEKKEEWEKVIEWGKKFFNVFNQIVEKLDSPRWTVNSMKVTGAASTVIARAYLRTGDIRKAEEWIRSAVKRSEENGENIERFLGIFLNDITSVECKDFSKVSSVVEYLMKYSKLENLRLDFTKFFEKAAECGYEPPKSTIEMFEPSDVFSKAIKRRLIDGKDHFLDIVLQEGEVKEFVDKYGANALIFLFDYMRETGTPDDEMLKFLNDMRESDNEKVRGLSLAFMGDIFLKSGKFKQALSIYRKALDTLPAISKFLKPVIEDLKTVLTGDMEGVFEEIFKDFSKGMEFILDLPRIIPAEWAKKAHLISDSDYALYISAIASGKRKKTRELLEKIKKPEKFPFYYYRLAKTYEKEDWDKAFEYHIKACEENEKLADMRYGTHIYHGLYLSKTMPWMSEKDETIWAGNITEDFSNLDVISPVRKWVKSKAGYIYAYPYPIDEAIDIYIERLKERNVDKLTVDVKKISKTIIKLGADSFKILGKGFEESDVLNLLKGLDVKVNERSDIVLIPFGIEMMDLGEFESVLKDVKAGIAVFANPLNEDSRVWKYPPFRLIRPYGYMKKILKENNLKVLDLEQISEDFYVISFSK
jgi:glycosyltransferase involved in cell wall biosynthesis